MDVRDCHWRFRLVAMDTMRTLLLQVLVLSAVLALFPEAPLRGESRPLNDSVENLAEESITVVRVKDDLLVKWLCPGLQTTSLLILNGAGEWEAVDSAFTVDPETQYSCLRRDLRAGFFRTLFEDLQESPRFRIMMPGRSVMGLPTPLRVELLRPDASLDWEVWESFLSLNLNGADIPSALPLHNGIASGLLPGTFSTGGSLILCAEGECATRTVELIPLEYGMAVAGELSEPLTAWTPNDGIIHVTDDVTIPAGSTLRIYPESIILLDPKKSVQVMGTVECLGTVEHPVVFAAADPENPWGQILHDQTATRSSYRGTFFLGGGDSAGAGHTERGPVIRVRSAEVEFEYCNFMDNYGKGLYGSGGDLTFKRCHFARCAMGMEVVNANIAIDRCAFTEMPMGGDVGDNDPLYLNGSGTMSVTNSVFALGGDDGIDLLSSSPLIENCVVRGFLDKGISVYYGAPQIRNCLVLENDYGISGKGDPTAVYVDRTTIVRNRVSVQSRDKYNEPDAVIKYYITNAILWDHTTAVQTDYPLEDISITYSCMEGAAPFPGEGNIIADPRFMNPAANNFRLQPDSPCLGSGEDGADMGFTYPDSR